MSRLIDADKLIERMKEDTSEAKKSLSQDNYVDKEVWYRVIQIIESYIDIIKAQPTAYDVDKVVVKIQVQAEMQLQRGIQENEPACLYASSCYAKAAEIVERGGIDEIHN